MNDIVFDPRDSILPPFVLCRHCGKAGLGILSTEGQTVLRRCRECMQIERAHLPRLKKEILYLDQFVVSNLMKALNPGVKGHERVISDAFWIELFQVLDVACRAHLVVCPSSSDHCMESLLSPFDAPLRQMYEYLSGGVTFLGSEEIRNQQLATAAHAWLIGVHATYDLSAEQVTRGQLHGWTDRIRVQIKGEYPDFVGDLRRGRDRAASALDAVFARWQKETGHSFDERLQFELSSYGATIVNGHREWLRRQLRISHGIEPMSLALMRPSSAVMAVWVLEDVLRRNGVAEDDTTAKVCEFLLSEKMFSVPFLRIMASLYAVVASKAAAGQKKLPTRGTPSDINTVSTLLPYCDAMFIDDECASLLADIPRERQLPYGTKIFSTRTKHDLLSYLKGILASAPQDHLQLVREVYGDNWNKPNTSLFSSVDP